MDQFLLPLLEQWPLLVVSIVSLLTGVSSVAIAIFKTKKAKNELELQKIEYEKQKLRIQEAALQGSFVLCPKCESEVYLKDSKIHYKS